MDAAGKLNIVLNNVNAWSQPTNGFCTRQLKTRAAGLFAAAPLEIIAAAQHALALPFQAVGCGAKLVVKTCSLISSASFFTRMNDKLSSPADFVWTAARVVAFAFGAVASVVLGFVISPNWNFRLHAFLGNITNQRQKLIDDAKLEVSTTDLTKTVHTLTDDAKKVAEKTLEAEQAQLAAAEALANAAKAQAEKDAAKRNLQADAELAVDAAFDIAAKAASVPSGSVVTVVNAPAVVTVAKEGSSPASPSTPTVDAVNSNVVVEPSSTPVIATVVSKSTDSSTTVEGEAVADAVVAKTIAEAEEEAAAAKAAATEVRVRNFAQRQFDKASSAIASGIDNTQYYGSKVVYGIGSAIASPFKAFNKHVLNRGKVA